MRAIPTIHAFGPFRLDADAEILFRGSEPLPVGKRAVALLRVLVERAGAPVSKDTLMHAAWSGLAVEESNLTVQIAALRRVLREEPGGDRWIETMPRRGYRFIGPVGTHVQTSVMAAPPQVEAAPELAQTPHRNTERRQITAVSCELTGNARRADGMDLEDWREAVGAFRRCVAETIARHNGFIASYLGNTMLILFGYPAAHEHDAERAVRAGLELCAAVRTLRPATDAPMHCRIGIATGMAIIGDIAESGARAPEIVGGTRDLAVRLQTSAQPDTVAIERATRLLVGNLFDCSDLDAIETDDGSEPMRRWQVLGERFVESRFEALRGSALSPLIGRDEEVDLLLRRWSRAKSGEGQVVLLSGEAGIGKSRLTAALWERLADQPPTRLRYFCSPQHSDSAFHPIISQMERASGLARTDCLQVKLDKLDALLAQTSTTIEDAALIADMLLLPNDGRYPTLELTPERRRQRMLTALESQLTTLTRQHPVLMIFEDAHWSDPTSLEAFGRVVDLIETLRLLLIVTFRPEFEPPWTGRPRVTTLAINRLAERDIGAIIDCIAGNKPLPVSTRQNIIERTDGIPLFVEEMTKAVLEAGEGAAAHTDAAVPSRAPAVPASLHASLMARLDRLGPAKEVAQIGAAIGRNFSYPLLVAVIRRPEPQLRAALDRLNVAGLLFRQGVPPHATYRFKHALVQDAAYGTLLRELRRALHARITETIESHFAEIAENQPEVLARHCTEAGLIEKAAGLWGKAGLRSLERSALLEAAEQFRRALAQMAILPATPALRREQIKLQVGLVNALMHVKGYPAPETMAAGERARLLIEQAEALGEPPEDPLLLYSVLFGIWVRSIWALSGDVYCDLAMQCLKLAEKQRSTVPLMIGHRVMGVSLVHTGNIAQGRAHLDRALALYNPAAHRPLATRFGQDLRVAILAYRSWALWFLGYPEAALADKDDLLKEAHTIDQAATLMFALNFTLYPSQWSGDYETANMHCDQLVALAEAKGAFVWKVLGKLHQSCLLALTSNAVDQVESLTSAITEYRSAGAISGMPWYLSCLARAYAGRGLFDDAWRCTREAIVTGQTSKEGWSEAEVHRMAGELALLSSRPDATKAESFFGRALAIARKQRAKSWELRAAMSIARLWRDQDRLQEARDLLAPIYGWFTQGFNTLDLKQAKAFIDTLI